MILSRRAFTYKEKKVLTNANVMTINIVSIGVFDAVSKNKNTVIVRNVLNYTDRRNILRSYKKIHNHFEGSAFAD